MKMYKIIPSTRAVEVIEYDGTYEQMKPHLKYNWLDHAYMTRARDMVFVNDTGRLDGTEQRDGAWWWVHDDASVQKFVGEALFWGTQGENNADPSISPEGVKIRICWDKPSEWVDEDPGLVVKSFDTVEDLLNSMEL